MRTLLVALLLSLSIPRASCGDPITIDFDNLADLSSVATSITRFTFSNATALTAGGASRANYSTASKQAWIVSTASCRLSKPRDPFPDDFFKTFPPFA